MTNPDNVGGLDDVLEKWRAWLPLIGPDVARRVLETCIKDVGELCRAAHAGGDAVAKLIAAADVLNTGAKLGLSTYTEDWKRLDMVLAAVKSKDSAPAGSGEVHPIPQELFDRAHRLRELAAANRLNECLPTIETMCGKNAGDAIRDAAALLRKLQQGAE